MLKNLLVIKTITVYNDDGLVAFRIAVGKTIQGAYDGLCGGYLCKTDEGFKYLAFHDEVVVC